MMDLLEQDLALLERGLQLRRARLYPLFELERSGSELARRAAALFLAAIPFHDIDHRGQDGVSLGSRERVEAREPRRPPDQRPEASPMRRGQDVASIETPSRSSGWRARNLGRRTSSTPSIIGPQAFEELSTWALTTRSPGVQGPSHGATGPEERIKYAHGGP